MSLCWYIFVVFCMGLVSVHVKAPHRCLFMAGAVLCWQSLPSWHRLTRQIPGGKPTTHHSLISISTNAGVAALRLWWRNSPSLKKLAKTKPPLLSACEPRLGFPSLLERSCANTAPAGEGMESQWHRERMRRNRGHYCKSVFTSKSEIFASVKLLP